MPPHIYHGVPGNTQKTEGPQFIKTQKPENPSITSCDVGASKNVVTHFLRRDYLHIFLLQEFAFSSPI